MTEQPTAAGLFLFCLRVCLASLGVACMPGFGLEDACDAVFLDLPAPHLALPFVHKALKVCSDREIEKERAASAAHTNLQGQWVAVEVCLLFTLTKTCTLTCCHLYSLVCYVAEWWQSVFVQPMH